MRGISRLGAALCCVTTGACGRPAHSVRAPGSTVESVATVDVDTDGDGIPDGEDRCPTDAETPNGFEDDDGCPDEIPEMIGCSWPLPNVRFTKNGDGFDAEAIAVLERIVGVLQDYPEATIEIAGHTDNRGSDAANQAISQQRAEAVRDYLIERGIDPARLTVVGYGEYQPIADNQDAAGRAMNRRVEFKFTRD